MSRECRGLRWLAVPAALAVSTYAPSGKAWTLPEHAEITRIALDRYAPTSVTRALATAVALSNDSEFHLCRATAVPFQAVPMDGSSAACIPYSALPALAGDHATMPDDLWESLTARMNGRPTLASSVIGAAVSVWTDFLSSSPTSINRPTAEAATWDIMPAIGEQSMNRRLLVRELDTRLQMIDHDYSSRAGGCRAHFQDATTSIQSLLSQLKSRGDAENALAQVVSHHIRSVQLAVAARPAGAHGKRDAAQRKIMREALLEHAFAIHFLQDAFSAGHIGTEHAIVDPVKRKQRHDYLNRKGIAATRALSVDHCMSSVSDASHDEMLGTQCWVAFGDGYLDAASLDAAAEATARVQLQFAMAVDENLADDLADDASCPQWCDETKADPDHTCRPQPVNTPSRQACDLSRAASLLDPFPAWVQVGAVPARTRDESRIIILKAGEALASLTGTPRRGKAVSAGAAASFQPDAVDPSVLGEPLVPCGRPTDGGVTPLADSEGPEPNESGPVPFFDCAEDVQRIVNAVNSDPKDRDQTKRDLIKRYFNVPRLGTPDVSLWRPVLVAWPAAQADIRTLEGSDSFGYGFATHVLGAATTMWAFGRSEVPGAVGGGFATGLAYREDSLLPGRDNRSLVEVNLGLGGAIVVGVPDVRYETILFFEARSPLLTLAGVGIAYATRSSGSMSIIDGEVSIGPSGVRLYYLMPSVAGPSGDAFRFLGWDLEVASISLGRVQAVRTASVGGSMDPELRLRIGELALTPHSESSLGGNDRIFTAGLELAGGYSWFL